MWTRKELKLKAKEALKRNYWKAVLVSLLLLILGEGVNPVASAGGGNNSNSNSNSSSNSNSNSSGYEVEDYVYEAGEDTISRSIASSVASELRQVDPVVVAAASVAMIVIFLIVVAIILTIEILLANPLIIGSQRFMLRSVDGKGDVADVGYAFDNSYLNCVKTMFFRELHIFLWALLFVIPGIYKKYQYYMVEYILAENPGLPYKDVLKLSTEMMNGHKWNTFVLDLSFILWHVLGMITCGILEIFYVQPYVKLTHASLYYAVCKANKNIAD